MAVDGLFDLRHAPGSARPAEEIQPDTTSHTSVHDGADSDASAVPEDFDDADDLDTDVEVVIEENVTPNNFEPPLDKLLADELRPDSEAEAPPVPVGEMRKKEHGRGGRHARTFSWGEFLMTWKPGPQAWQCTCPYHVAGSSSGTKCTRTRKERGPETLRLLKLWALKWTEAGNIGDDKTSHQNIKDAMLAKATVLSESDMVAQRKALRTQHDLEVWSSSESSSSTSQASDDAL